MLSLPILGGETQRKDSQLDASVNWVTEAEIGMVEARYVRRTPEYFIAYLSCQTGCVQACRFCHLTQSGQTAHLDVPVEDLWAQAEQVLQHYDRLCEQGEPRARKVHFNFMARGEPLASQAVLQESGRLLNGLMQMAAERALIGAPKISTILPRSMGELQLSQIFTHSQPDIYYSLYSMRPAFRRRWLPKALPAEEGLDRLRQWQLDSRKIPVLHWAMIEGENDSLQEMEQICQAVRERDLRVDINLVRYNPASPRLGREPTEEWTQTLAAYLRGAMPEGSEVTVVTRVGPDVQASCGMFVGGRLRG